MQGKFYNNFKQIYSYNTKYIIIFVKNLCIIVCSKRGWRRE